METENMRTLVLAKGEGGTEWNQEESGCEYIRNTGKIFVVMEMFFISEISWFYLQDITIKGNWVTYTICVLFLPTCESTITSK